jgi:hypothetical protein
VTDSDWAGVDEVANEDVQAEVCDEVLDFNDLTLSLTISVSLDD